MVKTAYVTRLLSGDYYMLRITFPSAELSHGWNSVVNTMKKTTDEAKEQREKHGFVCEKRLAKAFRKKNPKAGQIINLYFAFILQVNRYMDAFGKNIPLPKDVKDAYLNVRKSLAEADIPVSDPIPDFGEEHGEVYTPTAWEIYKAAYHQQYGDGAFSHLNL